MIDNHKSLIKILLIPLTFLVIIFVLSLFTNCASWRPIQDTSCFQECQMIYGPALIDAEWQGDDAILQMRRCGCFLQDQEIGIHIPFEQD